MTMAKEQLQDLLEQLRKNNESVRKSVPDTVKTTKTTKTVKNISKEMQDKVDAYIEAWEKQKELDRTVRELRKEIEPYMEQRGITYIESSNSIMSVQIKEQSRVQTTSRYTAYSVDTLKDRVPGEILQGATVPVVDGEILESLISLSGVMSKSELNELKNRSTVSQFTVNR